MSERDLFEFMQQLQAGLADDYRRITRRVKEDPGTAGDESEESWAELLRGWLPANYPVVTKGRVVGLDGTASPQVDILVLHPAYPKHLLNRKHYLAGGVVAAFECKLTIRTAHLSKAFSNGARVKLLFERRWGTPYKELNRRIIYGVLAHSHSWKGSTRNVAFSVIEKIEDKQFSGPQEPDELLDLICIADLGSYVLNRELNIRPEFGELTDESEEAEGLNHIATLYTCTWISDEKREPRRNGTVLGSFLSSLIERMAYEDSSLRSIAEYYISSMYKGGIGKLTIWHPELLSSEVLNYLKMKGPQDGTWSEWKEYQ